jgi:hypothetical protein
MAVRNQRFANLIIGSLGRYWRRFPSLADAP